MKGDFLPLQTSLTSPNFPARQPPGWCVEIFCVLWAAVAAQGSFWVDWEVRELCRVRLRTRLVSGMRRVVYAFRKCRLIPPHQSLTRQLPPQGEAFCTLCEHGERGVHGRYVKYIFELWFAFTIRPHPSPCRVVRKKFCKKASPWGEAVAQATDEGGKSAFPIGVYLSSNQNDTWVVPSRSSTNFLPFLSGSGEKRQLSKSRSTGFGSEQPEIVARNTATFKI